jgi:hypothetical protein
MLQSSLNGNLRLADLHIESLSATLLREVAIYSTQEP